MRITSFLSHNSDLSHSEAARVVRQKRVAVDGRIVNKPSLSVSDDQLVTLDGERIEPIPARYLMLNKPAGFICDHKPKHYPSALDLIALPRVERLHFAGRLDADTTGLVLLTDDGNWSHRVTSPKSACTKWYRVGLTQALDAESRKGLETGLMLRSESKPTAPAQVRDLDDTTIELGITEGRYHQVKRMLASVGNPVLSLHRFQIGDIVLDGDLEEGESRWLREAEIALFTP